MNNNPLVGVLISVYKADNPNYLKLALDSILNQSYKNIHLLIGVDGNVGEEIINTLYEFERRNNISIFWHKENRGLARVLNDLLEICLKNGYEYIARMDADDISMPDRFEKQINYLIKHPEIDVVGGSIEEIDEKNESRGKIIVYPEGPKDCYNFFSKRNPHAHPAVIFRKSFFDKAGCKYRPEYRQNQDTMLWFDGMKAGTKHANIPDVVLRFRFTDSLFKKRRNGWIFAKKQLQDRKLINKTLGYGFGATIFGYMMFIMLISPAWVKKIAYKVFR